VAEMKPETKIGKIVEKMNPLADWLEKNKPSVDVLRVTRDDMTVLQTYPKEALSHGIFVEGGGAKWRKFSLRPAP
jgi:hypothetical protein